MQTSSHTITKGPSQSVKTLAPEDNWDLVGNPTVYLDELPQPYRFINNCLDQMILKPVFNQITIIERKKKTPEYEGNLKEVSATGYMEMDGVTCTSKIGKVVLAGGIIEKSSDNNFSSAGVHSKVLLGDKFG